MPSTVWTGMHAYRKLAGSKPHYENTHGFTACQSNKKPKTPLQHYRATTFRISSAQNKEANILFSKNNYHQKKKIPHPTSPILLKTFLGTLQFLFPIYETGLMNYL